MATLFHLFWLFLKINLLSTSGPASIGLLHSEAVGTLLTEAQFIEAVGISNLLPGSEAIKLAIFTGYSIAGVGGALAAMLGAVLPPTLLMLGIVAALHRIRREAWMSHFIQGLTPSIAALMLFVAWEILQSGGADWRILLIGAGSLAAFFLKAPAPIVLLLAGAAGSFLFR